MSNNHLKVGDKVMYEGHEAVICEIGTGVLMGGVTIRLPGGRSFVAIKYIQPRPLTLPTKTIEA